MLHSIVPVEEIWAETDLPAAELREVMVHGCMMQVEPIDSSSGKVVRILSTDPQDYLKPEFQPGRIVLLTD